MFDSALNFRWTKDSPLHIVWMVGNTRNERQLTKKFSKKKYLGANVRAACKKVHENYENMTLRIVGNLLVGIARIHHKQMLYVFQDSRELTVHFDNLTKASSLLARPDDVTLPEIVFEMPVSHHDLSLSNIDRYNPGDYLVISEPPRPGSVCSTPESLYVASERDITIPDQVVPETSLLERTLAEEQYFGDNDNSFFEQDNSHDHLQQEARHEHNTSANTSRDQVLLFDQHNDSFSYIDGYDNTSLGSQVPQQESPHRSFTSPFSHDGSVQPPSHSTPSHFTLAHISPELGPEVAVSRFARKRRSAKKRVIDWDCSLPGSAVMDMDELPVDYMTRSGVKTEVFQKKVKAKDLLQLDTAFLVKESELATLFKRLISGSRTSRATSPSTPVHLTPISTPLGEDEEEIPHPGSTDLELERHRQFSNELSFREQSDQASNMLGSQHSTKSSSSLQHGSTLTRERPLMDNVRPGVLSPIADVENEEYSNSGIAGGVYGDSSYDLPPNESRGSSLNESTTMTFARRVALALEDRESVRFHELIPGERPTRKAAATSFFNLLSVLAKSSSYRATQDEPYSSIVITKPNPPTTGL